MKWQRARILVTAYSSAGDILSAGTLVWVRGHPYFNVDRTARQIVFGYDMWLERGIQGMPPEMVELLPEFSEDDPPS